MTSFRMIHFNDKPVLEHMLTSALKSKCPPTTLHLERYKGAKTYLTYDQLLYLLDTVGRFKMLELICVRVECDPSHPQLDFSRCHNLKSITLKDCDGFSYLVGAAIQTCPTLRSITTDQLFGAKPYGPRGLKRGS